MAASGEGNWTGDQEWEGDIILTLSSFVPSERLLNQVHVLPVQINYSKNISTFTILALGPDQGH